MLGEYKVVVEYDNGEQYVKRFDGYKQAIIDANEYYNNYDCTIDIGWTVKQLIFSDDYIIKQELNELMIIDNLKLNELYNLHNILLNGIQSVDFLMVKKIIENIINVREKKIYRKG